LSASNFLEKLKRKNILALPVPQGIRFVTNRGIDDHDVEQTITVFANILNS
jgi:hypothetical protein